MTATDPPGGSSRAERPRIWGKYRFEERIDSGGGSIVYRAREVASGRKVAIEVFVKPASEDRFDERLNEAIEAFARARGPGLAAVHEHGVTQDGARFVAMEAIEGETLSARLQAQKKLNLQEAVGIAAELAEALSALHAQGHVYAALEPSRVLVDRSASGVLHVKLLVGASKRPGPAPAEPREHGLGLRTTPRSGTYPAVVDGSPAYLSPEQIAGAELEPASDLYSLAALTYEMICGVPPFGREPVDLVLTRHATEPPVPPSSRSKGLPGGIDRSLLRALGKRPLDRHPTLLEFARELRALAAPPPPDPAKLAGREVAGRFRLGELLRHYAIGAAFSATDTRSGTPVEVELFSVGDDARAELFDRLRGASKLSARPAAGVVQIVSSGHTDDGLFYVVNEAAPGETLADRIARSGHLAPSEVVAITERIADALDAMHAEGQVHHELEPRQVILGPSLDIRLRLLTPPIRRGEASAPGVRPLKAIFGSPSHASPEEITDGWLGVRSNVYSLAAIVYEMLTGSPPFVAESAAQVLMQHVRARPEPLRSRAPQAGIPAELEAPVARALAKRPADRYVAAGDFAAELRDALEVYTESAEEPLAVPLVARPDGERPSSELAMPLTRSPQPRAPQPSIVLPLVTLRTPVAIPDSDAPASSARRRHPARALLASLALLALLVLVALAYLRTRGIEPGQLVERYLR